MMKKRQELFFQWYLTQQNNCGIIGVLKKKIKIGGANEKHSTITRRDAIRD